MRRDTKAIEASLTDYWRPDKAPALISNDLALRATATWIDRYLTHLAKHGDDDGRKWKLVPVNEPTREMWQAYRDTLFDGQSVYEDAGGFMVRTLKAWLTGKRPDPELLTYKKVLAAAPSITGEKE